MVELRKRKRNECTGMLNIYDKTRIFIKGRDRLVLCVWVMLLKDFKILYRRYLNTVFLVEGIFDRGINSMYAFPGAVSR